MEKYIDIGIWKSISKINHLISRHIQSMSSDKETNNHGADWQNAYPDDIATTKNISYIRIDNQPLSETEKENFRAYYMRMMSECFQDDLDTLREQEEMDEKSVGVLADALQAGMNLVFDPSDMRALLEEERKKMAATLDHTTNVLMHDDV